MPVQIGTYRSKPLLHNPFLKGDTVSVVRIAPPASRLLPAIRAMESQLGVRAEANGRVALRPFMEVVNELIVQDPGVVGTATGRCRMPDLADFFGGFEAAVSRIPRRNWQREAAIQYNSVAQPIRLEVRASAAHLWSWAS